jgi:isoleucyl-tRNA synthetase
LPISGEEGTRRNSYSSIEELYNEKKNQFRLDSKKNPFKGFEIGNMAENYDLVDLHKIVDEITLVSASGKPMMKEADLIDVWFDSGSMPMHNGIILLKTKIK